MELQHKSVEHNGVVIEFYMTPLTISERIRAQKQAKSDDPNEYGPYLFCQKARDEDGNKLFQPGQAAELKNDYPGVLIDKLLVAIVEEGVSEEEEKIDPKRSSGPSRKTAT